MQNSDNLVKQYLNAQVNYDEIKTGKVQGDLASVKCVNNADIEAEIEYKKFKERLRVFEKITTLKEAKRIAKEMFCIKDDVSFFKIGKAFVSIQSQANYFRIIVNSSEELICYNFNKKS